MRMQFKDGKLYQKIMKAHDSLWNEVHQIWKPEGMEMIAMDGSHILLADLFIAKEDFDIYECAAPTSHIEKGEKEGDPDTTIIDYETLQLSFRDYVKLLDRGKTDQIIQYTKPNDKRVYLQFKKENSKKVREFSMAQIDIDDVIQSTDFATKPSFKEMFTTKLNFASSILDELIKDGSIVAETILFETYPTKVIMKSEGSVGDMRYELEKEECKSYESQGECNSAFSIKFLETINNMTKDIEQIDMQLGFEAPMIVSAKFLTKSYVNYYLAPRVEQEEVTVDK